MWVLWDIKFPYIPILVLFFIKTNKNYKFWYFVCIQICYQLFSIEGIYLKQSMVLGCIHLKNYYEITNRFQSISYIQRKEIFNILCIILIIKYTISEFLSILLFFQFFLNFVLFSIF